MVPLQPGAQLLESAPESQFESSLAAAWPETRGLDLVVQRPLLDNLVLGPGNVVAGTQVRTVSSVFGKTLLNEVVTGRAGADQVRAVCSSRAPVETLALSPDARLLVFLQGGDSYALEVAGGTAARKMLGGRLLDWKAVPKP